MVLTDFGIFIDESERQSPNAPTPIEVTVSGIDTDEIDEL